MDKCYAFDETDPNYPAVQRLIWDYFGTGHSVDISVARKDDMYIWSELICGARPIGAMAYFRAGLLIYDFVADVVKWRFGPFDNVGSFLDFASGHGRFTRYLASVMPKERIWAAEILKDAVAFQQEQFGIQALQSTTVPEEFTTPQRFDMIFVGSLFTHLPDKTFTRWLKQLYSLLSPGGILVFSVHGEHVIPEGATMPESGIYYLASTEVADLDVEDYGATTVTDAYVRKAIQAVTGGSEFQYIYKGLNSYQDVYVISNAPMPAQPFTFDCGPQGHVDKCYWTAAQELELSGWAADITPGHAIKEVRVAVNGEWCGAASITTDRSDVAGHLRDSGNPQLVRSGWECVVTTPKRLEPFSDVLSVIATCEGGKSHALRTVMASSYLQFKNGATQEAAPPKHEAPPGAVERVVNAVAHLQKGEFGELGRKTLDLLKRGIR
jgi:SAM-dependent methyltransferase